MKYLILILLISSCAVCEKEDCVDYCDRIQFSDTMDAIHRSVSREIDPNPRACYEVPVSFDPELAGSYCIELDTREDY